MQLTRLDPHLRKNLKDLLLGYVEHCEISSRLMARIDFPIYHHGFKYGAPVFTHTPHAESAANPPIGLIGHNAPHSHLASEVLLELVDLLVQWPSLAGNAVLRILPVGNPVALELEEDAPTIESWPELGHHLEVFRAQSPGGVIEIEASEGPDYRVEGDISPLLFTALLRVFGHLPERRKRRLGIIPRNVHIRPIAENEPWFLKLSVPGQAVSAAQVRAAALFISRILQAHESLQKLHV